MAWKGSARFGASIVYKTGGYLGEMRFTDLTEAEARDTLNHWGNPNDITVSKENRESQASDTLEQAQELANRLRAELGYNRLEFNRTRKRVSSEYDQEIGVIRKALKGLAPTLSVRRDRGTAYSWIKIRGSLEFGEFTDEEKRALEKFGLNYGGNCALISPNARRYYVEKAAKMLGEDLPPELAKTYRETDEWKARKLEKVANGPSQTEQKVEPAKPEEAKISEFEQMKQNIALGVGASPEKIEHVNRWLTYLMAELKGIGNKAVRAQLAQMCMASLGEEAGIELEEEEEPSYIG